MGDANNNESLSTPGRSEVGAGDSLPFDIVPAGIDASEQPSKVASGVERGVVGAGEEARNIFDDPPFRLEQSDDVEDFGEAISLVTDSESLSSDGEGLARGRCGKHVDSSWLAIVSDGLGELSDVSVIADSWKSLGEDVAAEGVDFGNSNEFPFKFDSRIGEASADSAAQIELSHSIFNPRFNISAFKNSTRFFLATGWNGLFTHCQT